MYRAAVVHSEQGDSVLWECPAVVWILGVLKAASTPYAGRLFRLYQNIHVQMHRPEVLASHTQCKGMDALPQGAHARLQC